MKSQYKAMQVVNTEMIYMYWNIGKIISDNIEWGNKYKPPYAIRISARNFGFSNGIFAVPLYAAFCIVR